MLLQFRMRELGIDVFSISFLSTITSGIGSLASPFWGALSDEMKERKKTLMFPLIAGSVVFLFYSLVKKSWEFFLVAAVFTFLSSAYDPIVTAILIESSMFKPNVAILLLNVSGSLGLALGRLFVSPILNFTSVLNVMIVLYVVSLISLLFVMLTPSIPHPQYEITRTNLQRIFSAITSKTVLKRKNLWAMYLGSFLRQFGIGGTFAAIGVYLNEVIGLTKSQTLLLASSNPFMQIPSHLLFGWLVSRISSKVVATTGMFLSGIGAFLFAIAKVEDYTTVLLGYVVSGMGFGAFINGAVNFVSENVPQNRKAEFLGLLTSVRMFGSLFGPLAAGLLSSISFKLMFVVMGCAMIFGALVTGIYCEK
ncbi:major facilitator superfamily MFS_1 [Pseudothermotoga thermarum DSM 5069]|uniref:Major facilitator superfamily MFS_1 n=1 Tax=Pseudothermotoga thermarum DSM 5069 TaxID=688269 RepID=F7YVU2_9THEM|nr:major facilitator superfamily MFS_1 [Pseudothermotoga thermarum DSM 5069]